jgi:hypothetical protein
MPRLSRQEWEAQQNRYTARRHENFRMAAEAVALAFAEIPEVQAVALFGSVAAPPKLEITRRGWELLHHAKDVDLAVWIDRPDDLAALKRARVQALRKLLAERDIGVADHQVDVFLIEPETDRYLGRLCKFASCPKGHRECEVAGCGQAPFLKQHEDFEFFADALNEDRVVRLYQRHGVPR